MVTLSTPRQASNAVRQQRIVHAALTCFTERGVEQTAIGDICARADASVGSVYHHFGSKEALAGAVYCQGIQAFQEGYLEALAQFDSARAALAAVVGYHIDWVVAQPLWARYLLQTRSRALDEQATRELEQLNARFFSAMAAWFGERVRAGQIRRLPRALYVAVLVGPCQEWARTYLKGEEAAPDAALRRALADCVWRAVGAADGAHE